MATSKQFLTYLLEQLSDLEEITHRDMMGEYIIYYRGKIAAYVCDDRFLVKPTEAAKTLMPRAPFEPPYKGAKDMILVEDVDNKEFFRQLFLSMYYDLAYHKPRKQKIKDAKDFI